MGKKYQIWDKTSDVYTPSGEVFTPEEWTERYKWVNNPNTHMIIATGTINGSLCMEYWQTIQQYRDRGADIPDSIVDDPEAVIEAMEAFEEAEAEAQAQAASLPTAEERIAASLELQNMYTELSMMEE